MRNVTIGSHLVYFAGQTVALTYAHKSVSDLIYFLFGDISSYGRHPPRATFNIQRDGDGSYHVQSNEGRSWWVGVSLSALAQFLLTTTLYHLLYDLNQGVAIHAAALARDDIAILIPGPTGAGKSTLSAWLTLQGWQYQTDELVFLPSSGEQMKPFTRPICLKLPSVPVISPLISSDTLTHCLEGPEGLLIPHRLLNANFMKTISAPNVILIPRFRKDTDPELIPISGAKAGLHLMGCHVNARNLSDHGFAQISDLARKARSYQLAYGRFDGLAQVLDDL